MSKSTGIIGRITTALRGLGLKAPWQITGPTSSPEYVSHLPKATEYRPFGPASPPKRPSIPQADPDRVYDIKYFTRDTRRARLNVKSAEEGAETQEAVQGGGPVLPGTPMKWKGKFKSILDNEHNGYTL